MWGDENPLGKKFSYFEGENENVQTVVGVVKDVLRSDRDRDNRVGYFMNAYQDPWFDIGIHVELEGEPMLFEQKLVRTVAEIDSNATVSNIGTIRSQNESGLVGLNFIYVLFITFAGGALLMASAGLYGVVSFTVGQRIREIGIKLALGAAPSRVISGVFGQGFVNVIIGVAIGVVMAYLLRFLFMQILQPLYESMFVYGIVLVGILVASSIAILIPSIRGGTTDPAEALRID